MSIQKLAAAVKKTQKVGSKRGRKSLKGRKSGGSTASKRSSTASKSNETPIANEENGKQPLGKQEYEVEQVLDRRVKRNLTLYLVKWKGYSHDENTWEPEFRMNCPDLINKFLEKQLEQAANIWTGSTGKKKNLNSSRNDADNMSNEDDEEPTPKLHRRVGKRRKF